MLVCWDLDQAVLLTAGVMVGGITEQQNIETMTFRGLPKYKSHGFLRKPWGISPSRVMTTAGEMAALAFELLWLLAPGVSRSHRSGRRAL